MKGIIGWTMEKDNDGKNTKKKSNIEKKKIVVLEKNSQ